MSEVKYYYQQEPNMEDYDLPVFAITPKEYFDKEGHLLDGGIGESDESGHYVDLPQGFHEMEDSIFEFDGELDDALKLLADNPMFEQKDMLNEDE